MRLFSCLKEILSNAPQHSRILLVLFVSGFILTQAVFAQRASKDPHIAYVYPAGCQRGKTCKVVVGGQHLKEAFETHIAGDGVKVEYLGWYRPMTRGEYNNLRMALTQAKEMLIAEHKADGITRPPTADEIALVAGISEEVKREMHIYRERNSDPRRQPNDQLQEEVSLRLTIDSTAEIGKRELRLLTENAMSNPIWFHVGRWAETREEEPNDHQPTMSQSSFPVVINGQITPGDVDSFSIDVKKGMNLVVQVAARDVIPFLADAVPGWFQAVMSITDSNGEELLFADSFHYRQDPVLHFEVPKDGTYTLRLHDSLYRGREDFVYRVTIGEIPFVTSVYPLGARVDSEIAVDLNGWNLKRSSVSAKTMPRRNHRPIAWYSVPQGNEDSVRFPLQIGLFPEVLDQEPNNTLRQAQDVTSRMTINGRIDYPGDEDVFRIDGTGQLVVEVSARRQGSPLDSMVILTDGDGRMIAMNDDHEDKSQGLSTHHADSHLRATLAGMGEHYLRIVDTQDHGGNDFAYRMSLRAPSPDYELRVIPSTIMARPGTVVPITVFALRKDGFDEDIELALVNPPDGLKLQGAIIPGTRDHVRMTLAIPSDGKDQIFDLSMQGVSLRNRRMSRNPIVRPAIPAEQMMQAFIWYHLVPVENWRVITSGRSGSKMPFQIPLNAPTVRLPQQGNYDLSVTPLPKHLKADEMHVEISEPPPGISAEFVKDDRGMMAIRFNIDSESVSIGDRNNLLLRVFRQWTPAKTSDDENPKQRQTDYGYLPALPYEIVRSR